MNELHEQSEPATGVLGITNLGTRRQVTVSTNGHAVRFETALSETLVRGIFADKGPRWVKDSIDRFEDPAYVERPLARLIARFSKTNGKVRVLDLGCGSGASSAALARMGFHVIGIDPVEASVRIGTRAVQECGVSERVTFVGGTGAALPIRTGSFDVVLLCAVIEHVPPACRLALLQEAWRALRSGGLLLIHDTPNRLWPYDGHTTGLWFMTWQCSACCTWPNGSTAGSAPDRKLLMASATSSGGDRAASRHHLPPIQLVHVRLQSYQ